LKLFNVLKRKKKSVKNKNGILKCLPFVNGNAANGKAEGLQSI
jgi:hypothetical protein